MKYGLKAYVYPHSTNREFVSAMAILTKELLSNMEKDSAIPVLSTFKIESMLNDMGRIEVRASIDGMIKDVDSSMTSDSFIDALKYMQERKEFNNGRKVETL